LNPIERLRVIAALRYLRFSNTITRGRCGLPPPDESRVARDVGGADRERVLKTMRVAPMSSTAAFLSASA
jgi:hypothetical protein